MGGGDASAPAVAKALVETKPTTVAQAASTDETPYYSLQVFAAVNKKAAERFIESNHLTSEAHVVQAQVNGQTMYRVLNGHYTDKAGAWGAINAMPESVQAQKPLVRYFKAKQTA